MYTIIFENFTLYRIFCSNLALFIEIKIKENEKRLVSSQTTT